MYWEPAGRWGVFSPDGAFLGHVELPAGLNALEFGSDHVLGTHIRKRRKAMPMIVATGSDVLVLDSGRGTLRAGGGLEGRRPTCLAAHPRTPARVWCGTDGDGVFGSGDGGASWQPAGLRGRQVMALAVSPAAADVVWAGTEPSEVWRSGDGGRTWERAGEIGQLPSASEWSFPPRPETHHVRWIACHPREPGRLWVAIEAGALISTRDGGRSWQDRVLGGPFDTHELAVHPAASDTLRVSAGDGYYESHDGGATWDAPRQGLEVGYLRSVAIDPGDPETAVVSAASHPHAAYLAGRSDGRLYRRSGRESWQRVTEGWPEPPDTIAPLLAAGSRAGELWAADERGVHRSEDGGASWRRVAAFPTSPRSLRGLALLRG